MSPFLYLVLLVHELHATVHCASPNNSEGKVITYHLSQQNGTPYKISLINSDFAFNLYWRFIVDIPHRNTFFSLVSIFAVLAMLSLEACSRTQTQILGCLGFNLTGTSMIEILHGFASLEAYSRTQTQILGCLRFNLTDTSMIEILHGFQHMIYSLNFPKKKLELQMGNTLFTGKWLEPLAKLLDDVKTCQNSL